MSLLRQSVFLRVRLLLAAPALALPAQAVPPPLAPCSVIVNNTADNGSHSLRDAVACAASGGRGALHRPD